MKQEKDCLFCKIAAGEIPSEIIFESEELLAFRDINPQAPTHILIIPREHISTTNELEEKHAALVGKMILAAKQLAQKEGVANQGYRLVFNCNRGAGQAVFHIHLHLLGGRAFSWPPG